MKKGNFVAKSAGKKHAHQFIKSGDEVLEILDVGLNVANAITYYPDEKKKFFYKRFSSFLMSEGTSLISSYEVTPSSWLNLTFR